MPQIKKSDPIWTNGIIDPAHPTDDDGFFVEVDLRGFSETYIQALIISVLHISN